MRSVIKCLFVLGLSSLLPVAFSQSPAALPAQRVAVSVLTVGSHTWTLQDMEGIMGVWNRLSYPSQKVAMPKGFEREIPQSPRDTKNLEDWYASWAPWQQKFLLVTLYYQESSRLRSNALAPQKIADAAKPLSRAESWEGLPDVDMQKALSEAPPERQRLWCEVVLHALAFENSRPPSFEPRSLLKGIWYWHEVD